MSITGTTPANACAVLANCAVDMIKKTLLDANIQSALPYLVLPARVLDSFGPAALIAGTACSILSSQKQMRARVQELNSETGILLTEKNITPLPVDYTEKRSDDAKYTVWIVANSINLLMLIVNFGIGIGMGSYVNAVQNYENTMLDQIRSYNSSNYCKTIGDDSMFFHMDARWAINWYGDKIDRNIGDTVGILATFKIIAAVSSLFCLLASVTSECSLGIFKTNKKHAAIVLTMSLAYTVWLALGIYQAVVSNQVPIGSNLNRGWNDECSPLVRWFK